MRRLWRRFRLGRGEGKLGGEPMNKFYAAKPAFESSRGGRVCGIYFRTGGILRRRW